MSSAEGLVQQLNGADIMTLPAPKKKQAGPGPAGHAAAAVPSNAQHSAIAGVADSAPTAAAPAAEPVAMEEDYAFGGTINPKGAPPLPAANQTPAAAPQAIPHHPSLGWPAYAAHHATDSVAVNPAGFATGRTPPSSSKPSSRVQQRRARGRGAHQGGATTAAPAADLQWQPESLECVGESSDPREAKDTEQQRVTAGSSEGPAAAAAAAEKAAPEEQHGPDTYSDDAAAAAAVEPPPMSVMAKATAAGARARQQQQQAGVGAQQPQWQQQQQWQMRDTRISAGSSTTCNICASESGGSSSSGSVTGPFAGRGGDEVESRANESRGMAAAADLEKLGIGRSAAVVRDASAAKDRKG